MKIDFCSARAGIFWISLKFSMKSRIYFFAAFAILPIVFFAPSASYAGGSFFIEDIKPILAQSPEIQKYLFATLELEKSGNANRIGNNVNPRLGGTRLGPYCIYAKPKGARGENTLEVCINTEYYFRDKAGKTCELEQAYSVKEKFVSAEIKPKKE